MDTRKWDHDEDATTFLMGQRPVLEAEKRGPPLKNRLVGDAEMYKGLLDRESLRAADGVKYFRDTMRPHFKRAQSVFPLEFFIRSIEQEEEASRWSSGSAKFHSF